MRKYMVPLWVFVSGQILLLVVALLMPSVDSAATTLASDTAAVDAFAGTWWTWLMSAGVVRLLVYLFIEAAIFWATFKAFLAVRTH